MAGSKKYPVKTTFKEAGPKYYGSFKITKKIGQEAFQLELPER